jgi:hypothetical protein
MVCEMRISSLPHFYWFDPDFFGGSYPVTVPPILFYPHIAVDINTFHMIGTSHSRDKPWRIMQNLIIDGA